MAAGGRRLTWAPLVTIAEEDAKRVDKALGEWVTKNPGRSLELFLRDCRESVPVLRLYVRYGVAQT